MTATALITTTINIPNLLMDYARNAKEHGHSPKIIVAGDRRTPGEAADFCASIPSQTGIECEYLDCAAQDRFMASYPELNRHLPWNCVQRRNVAILKAIADQAEVVITIDDDNFVIDGDYFGVHQQTGKSQELESFGEEGQWFNICQFLDESCGQKFFPRGYSVLARQHRSAGAATVTSMKTAVTAGLWLGDPDIDAVTRLAGAIDATGYMRQDNFFVSSGAWVPFNSQNTALTRESMAAYFLSPYVGRYDDIFASFIVKRIADHLGEGISFGHPLVRQDRNTHNLLHDLQLETMGMHATDAFVAALTAAPLSATSWPECTEQLCSWMEESMEEFFADLQDHYRKQLEQFFAGYRLWTQLPIW